MRTIIVMYDSLNRHMLSSYGCDWSHTPNFQRLSEKCVTFDNHFVGSMPCMPARRELHTGRHNFLHRSWGPLEPFDNSVFATLSRAGVYTHLVSDHYHYWEDGGATYHNRYSSWEIVRGQENDKWKGVVEPPETPEHLGQLTRPHWVNRQYMDSEEKTPQARTFKLGLEFLETNHQADNWCLHIETFDPHEPFFTHEQWKKLYPQRYDGPMFNWPKYERVSECPEAVRHLRHEYAALLSQCDHYLGQVLDFMDHHDMWKDTMLIVCTDHGFLLGEHDWWAKCRMPFYNEVAWIPFFIWNPLEGTRNERRRNLTQTIDIAPTLLDFFKLPKDPLMTGHSLLPMTKRDQCVRDAGLFGIHGGQVNVTDGRHVYMRAPAAGNQPLNDYTHMPTHMIGHFSVEEMRHMQWHPGCEYTQNCPVMRVPQGNLAWFDKEIFSTKLFDNQHDPEQKRPIDDPELEKTMIHHLQREMRRHQAPEEQFERLGLKTSLA